MSKYGQILTAKSEPENCYNTTKMTKNRVFFFLKLAFFELIFCGQNMNKAGHIIVFWYRQNIENNIMDSF
jgi:hypothetical protein